MSQVLHSLDCQNTLSFTDRSFDGVVLRSEIPVLVDFGAKGAGRAATWRQGIDTIAQRRSTPGG